MTSPVFAINRRRGAQLRRRYALPPRPAAVVFHLAWALTLALIAMLAMTIIAHAQAQTQSGAAPRVLASVSEARAGSLLIRDDDNRYVEAVRLGTDISLTVSGPTLRARVTQMFQNPTDRQIEAVYVYPLSEGSAVDTLKMVIGTRVVVGEIKERKAARAIYEAAKAAGKKTTLMEQERPNIFTNSVANIGPGETVVVQIEYQEAVKQTADLFSLRLPLVVGPRYNPKPIAQTVEFTPGGSGWGQVTDPVPDRNRIEPPVLDPRVHAPTNPVAITVRLNAGFPLGEVKSHHHAAKIETLGEDARVITLAEGPVPADRDFELTWRPATSRAPSVGVFRERVGDADYLLAFVTPPALSDKAADQPAAEARAREIIFVIDNSGSMGGPSIAQAKASLAFALGRLKPTDRFNVIRFDHTMDVLFPDTVTADAGSIAQAQGFVAALQAKGGTEMVAPMRAALTDRRTDNASLIRQVVFLTDGAVGNEDQLSETIAQMRGRSRVFMVGIGSAPNSFLMTRAAELGRGAFTHIGAADQVESRMRALFEKLENPAVTNLVAQFSADGADATPGLLPDLYRGEPIVIAAKLKSLDGTLTLKGMIGDTPWSVALPIGNAAEGEGLSKLWARRKIADAEVARTTRRLSAEEADGRILTLALDHHLVTRLTSLVAVDKTPSRPEGAPLARADVPLNLPAGWDFDKVFGGERAPRPERKAAPAQPRIEATRADVPARMAARALAVMPAAPASAGAHLPGTATDAELRMWAGFALLMISMMIAILWRRRTRLA